MWFIAPIFESAESLSAAFLFAVLCAGLVWYIRIGRQDYRQATKNMTAEQKAKFDAQNEADAQVW